MAIRDDDPTRPALDHAYADYRTAMSCWRAAAKAGHVETTERAAERLLQARVLLYRSLVASGWQAPPGVEVQLERDVALVDAPADFEALLSA